MSQSCPAKHFTWSVVEGWILEFSEFQESLPGNRSNLITRALGRRSCNSCTMWFVDDLDSNGYTMMCIRMYMVRLHAWGSALKKNIYNHTHTHIYTYTVYIICIHVCDACLCLDIVSFFLKHIYTYTCTEYIDIHLVRFLSMEFPCLSGLSKGVAPPSHGYKITMNIWWYFIGELWSNTGFLGILLSDKPIYSSWILIRTRSKKSTAVYRNPWSIPDITARSGHTHFPADQPGCLGLEISQQFLESKEKNKENKAH